MFDFHTHILFDCDHGVQNEKQYTKMIKKYAKQGFDAVVLTPHLHHPGAGCKSENIEKNFARAKEIADQFGVEVYLGCELYFDGTNSDLSCYAIDDHFLLVEFPVEQQPLMLESRLRELQKKGYVIVIAHVERYPWLSPKSLLLSDLRNMGCLFQVNMESVRNRSAKPYLKARMVDLIASDNHGDFRAPKRLRKVLEKNQDILFAMDGFYLGENK